MAPRSKRNGKIDEEIEETFPASDPPAFMAGNLGAPRGRKSGKPGRKAAKRKPAKKKVVTKTRPKKAKTKKRATKRRKAR